MSIKHKLLWPVFFALLSLSTKPLFGHQYIGVSFQDNGTTKIHRKNNRIFILLPTQLSKAISRHFPEFKLPGNKDYKGDWVEFFKDQPVPFLAFDDFNYDGEQDIAALLLSQNSDRWKLVIFHKIKSRYVPLTLLDNNGRRGGNGDSYGPIQGYGLLVNNECENGKQCLEFFRFESAVFHYFWNGKKYEEVNVSD